MRYVQDSEVGDDTHLQDLSLVEAYCPTRNTYWDTVRMYTDFYRTITAEGTVRTRSEKGREKLGRGLVRPVFSNCPPEDSPICPPLEKSEEQAQAESLNCSFFIGNDAIDENNGTLTHPKGATKNTKAMDWPGMKVSRRLFHYFISRCVIISFLGG